MLDPREHMTYEAVVSITAGSVLSCGPVPGARTPITLGEYSACQELVRADHDFRAGLRRRGIDDPGLVLVEAWGIGGFARDEDEGRRLVWTLCFYRAEPHDNPYAKPIGGLHAVVDLDDMAVVRVEDLGVVPLPPDPGNYTADTITPRDPSSPSRSAARGGQLRGGRVERALAEVALPRLGFTRAKAWCCTRSATRTAGGCGLSFTGPRSPSSSSRTATRPFQGWRNAFDIGEYGIGTLANSLELGCDCLGEIRYFDVQLADERGEPYRSRTPSACTRRTTASCGSISTATRARGGARSAGWWRRSSSPSATTSTPSTGTSARTARSSGDQADRHRPHAARSPGQKRLRDGRGARRPWRRTTSTSSASGSTWRWTATEQFGLRGRDERPAGP